MKKKCCLNITADLMYCIFQISDSVVMAKMGTAEKFCLRRNDFERLVLSYLRNLTLKRSPPCLSFC